MNKIDEYIESLPVWQQENLRRFRKIIHEVEPTIIEDFKWNVPVFVFDGMMYFAMSAFKAHTKYNFILNGALLDDTMRLFNNGFDSKKSRGIDLKETQSINESELRDLIQESFKKSSNKS